MAQIRPDVVTVEAFQQFIAQQENGRLLELLHGEIVEKMPTEAHGKITALIAHLLLAFVLPRGVKAHVGVEVRHETPDAPYNSRLLDVLLRFSDSPAVTSGALEHMPDLEVEIQSSADCPRQMREKALHYLQNGTTLVWLVYVESQHIEVCTLDDNDQLTIETAGIKNTLYGGAVLPEFTLHVCSLFTTI